MINKNLLKKEVQQYIADNLKTDMVALRMKKSPFPEVSSFEIIQQMQGRKIAQTKFSFLTKEELIIYPPHLNLEQASSQAAAKFKQNLISGKKGVDLTGGTGIDSFFISEAAEEFYYVEPNLDLLEIVEHNFSVLGRKNTSFINTTAEEFISTNTSSFDFIYLDPSRRDENKNKKILLEDLAPNVVKLQEKLMHISSNVLIKLSPLLDLQQAILQLNLSTIYVISLKNEVKELIVELNHDRGIVNKNPFIRCINLETNHSEFSFYWLDEKQVKKSSPSLPEAYLYLPNASILKSGAFKLISRNYNLKKLDSNTHLYTSTENISDFPGRVFFVLNSHFNPQKTDQKKFNIISRNHPLKVEEIKKKYKLIEGGEKYLFFTRTKDKIFCILAEIIE